MLADETKHKLYLEERKTKIQAFEILEMSIICWDNMAQVIATENATFLDNGEAVTEEIIHEMTLYCDSNNCVLLQSDAYYESSTGFSSASYLSPEALAQAEINAALGGSGACIRYVAHNEVGANGSSEDSNGNMLYLVM